MTSLPLASILDTFSTSIKQLAQQQEIPSKELVTKICTQIQAINKELKTFPASLERYEVLQALRNELRTQQKANRDAFTTLATHKKQLEDIVYKGRYWVESINRAEEGKVPTSEILLYARILGQNSGPPEDWDGVTPLPAMFGPPCLEGNDIKTMMTAGAAQTPSQHDLSEVCS